ELKAAIAAASNPDLQTDLEERQKEFVAAAGASPQNSTEVEKTRTAFFAAKERREEAKSIVDFLKGKLSAENGLSSSGDILVALETKETEYDEKISDLKSEIANNEKICAEKAQCIVTLERKATKIANQLERLDRLESIELQRK